MSGIRKAYQIEEKRKLPEVLPTPYDVQAHFGICFLAWLAFSASYLKLAEELVQMN
ncbi:hypothetical protein ACFLTQ_02340 [Chloroflexota bacterium]